MDWQHRTLQWLQKPQSILSMAGAVVIVGLIGFQAGWFSHKAPQFCELISKCHLRHGDLQRIQVALGEAGLNEFTIEDQKLLVPKDRHTEYLKAVSERDALPMDLRDNSFHSISNPLLSRSQQQALKWQQKKRQLREMILRMPFVQQAWLEIDSAPSGSPFQPARQSAVLSIQPNGDRPLEVQHVETLRRMISGAVAGLQAQQIEVIDLSEGFAYDQANQQSATSMVQASRVSASSVAPSGAFSTQQKLKQQQQDLEDQIKLTLDRFAGLEVDVHLSPCRVPHQPIASNEKSVVANEPQLKPLVAGSNGVASIYDASPKVSPPAAQSNRVPVTQVAYPQTVDGLQPLGDHGVNACRVAIKIEVPEAALKNVATSLMPYRAGNSPKNRVSDRVEQKFDTIRPQIEREVASLVPPSWIQASGSSPIEVTLRRTGAARAAAQNPSLAQLFDRFWPSAAALLVGLVLLSMVVHKSASAGRTPISDSDILSLAEHRKGDAKVAKQAKEKINRMFQDDPDGAAAAIEGWIKKAS